MSGKVNRPFAPPALYCAASVLRSGAVWANILFAPPILKTIENKKICNLFPTCPVLYMNSYGEIRIPTEN